MEDEGKITDIGQPLNIHDARLEFIKKGRGKVVQVVVRPKKKGPTRRGKFPFIEDINDDDPNYWTTYRGQRISVYHRRDKYEYVNKKQRSIISIDLGQKLEELVRKVYFKTPNRKFQIN
jgi:hypothetical protein